MKVSDAAQAAGVSVATFKFYLREGLVPPGRRINQTRSEYDEDHVRRVRLVRALLDAGGLSVGQAKAVLTTLDDGSSLVDTFRAAQHAMTVHGSAFQESSPVDTELVDQVIAAQGWVVGRDNPGFTLAANVLDALRRSGLEGVEDFVTSYAAAADLVARADMAALAGDLPPDSVAELMVSGTVLGDTLMAALRRLAQQHHSTIAAPATTTRSSSE